MTDRQTTCVVVALFNEEKSLESTVLEIQGELTRMGADFEILIVDDGSFDQSPKIAAALSESHSNVRVVTHAVNKGLGHVYKTGFSETTADWLIFFPADGQFPASNLGDFMKVRGEYDLILGYLPERPCGLSAKVLSWLERRLYRILFGEFPKFQGLLMVRMGTLRQQKLQSEGRGWGILMEMILRFSRGSRRIISIPNCIRPREFGDSKVRNWRTIYANLKELFILRAKLGAGPPSVHGS